MKASDDFSLFILTFQFILQLICGDSTIYVIDNTLYFSNNMFKISVAKVHFFDEITKSFSQKIDFPTKKSLHLLLFMNEYDISVIFYLIFLLN